MRGINKTLAFTGKRFSLEKAADFPFPPRNFPFFYGWVILVASVVGMVMSIPGQTMGVGVFTDFLITATGLDRLGISTAYMVGTICSSLLLPFSGQLLDKRGARFLIVLSSLGLSFSLILLGRLESILQTIIQTIDRVGDPVAAFVLMSAIFFLIRQFGQGLMTLSSRNMLSKWFDRRRGLAVGIAGTFISFGFSGSPLFLNLLINWSDWQSVCLQLAVIIGVGMTIFGWVFFRDNPEECGLLMDGDQPDGESADSMKRSEPNQGELSVPIKIVRRSYTFWVFNVGISLHSLIATALTFHIVSLGAASGLDRSQVFALFLPMSVASVLTNFFGGWISDRVQLKYLLMVNVMALFIGTLSILNLDLLIGRIGLVVGFGMSGGLFGCLASVAWPRYFDRKYLGAISGLNMATMVFASAIGPALFGMSLSFTNRYSLAVWICAALPLLVFLCSQRVKNHA